MDYEAIRGGLELAIPFNRYIGLEIGEVAPGRGTVTLPDREDLRNHVGSQHAGALFGAGEAASGAAFVGAFAERLADLTPLAQSAEIFYKKIAKGAITATGTLAADSSELLSKLESEGKIEFPIEVELTDTGGDVVATMTVRWHVRQKSA
jgi:acyl-coenzyme A thioesterase PaaI-like protein